MQDIQFHLVLCLCHYPLPLWKDLNPTCCKNLSIKLLFTIKQSPLSLLYNKGKIGTLCLKPHYSICVLIYMHGVWYPPGHLWGSYFLFWCTSWVKKWTTHYWKVIVLNFYKLNYFGLNLPSGFGSNLDLTSKMTFISLAKSIGIWHWVIYPMSQSLANMLIFEYWLIIHKLKSTLDLS